MTFLDSCIIDYINGKLTINELLKQKYCINSIVDMKVCVDAENKRELNPINKNLDTKID